MDAVAPLGTAPALNATAGIGGVGLLFTIVAMCMFYRYREVDEIRTRDVFLTMYQNGMVIIGCILACFEPYTVYQWGFFVAYLMAAFNVSNFAIAFTLRCFRCAALCRHQAANVALARTNVSTISIAESTRTASLSDYHHENNSNGSDLPSIPSVATPRSGALLISRPIGRLRRWMNESQSRVPWDYFASNQVRKAAFIFMGGTLLYFTGVLIFGIVHGPATIMDRGWGRLFIIQLPALIVLTPLSLAVTPTILYALKDFDDIYGVRRDCFFTLYVANFLVFAVLVVIGFSYNDPSQYFDYRASTQLDFVLGFYFIGSFTSTVLPTYNAWRFTKSRQRSRALRATISTRPPLLRTTKSHSKQITLEHTQSSLQQLLADPVLMNQLLDFSARIFASENLLFYVKYWQLRKVWGCGLQPALNKPRKTAVLQDTELPPGEIRRTEKEERLHQLRLFVNDFFGEDAKSEVNIPSTAKTDVANAMAGVPENLDFLGPAYSQVMKNVFDDVFFRFLCEQEKANPQSPP